MPKFIFISLILVTTLGACTPSQSEQALEKLDKKSAREVTLITVPQGDSVLHITRQYIWFNGEQIASKADTIVTAKKPNTWSGTDTSLLLHQIPIYVTVQ